MFEDELREIDPHVLTAIAMTWIHWTGFSVEQVAEGYETLLKEGMTENGYQTKRFK